MQTSATDPLVGRTLEGRYRLLDRIARGGMSTVYAAVDERLDRNVAVKVMSSALSADPAFTDRFSREARAAARLTHLNTVSVYDQGQEIAADGHHVYLVMELIEGRTLRDLLREKHRLTPAETISIMEPVLSALAAAHRAGLVHRDIKPENILLSDEGVVKVADFGLARAVEADAASTRTGLMMGTVAYCAPEQITKGHADQRSDVYSAGVVMFELLTGQPPYRGDTAMNVAYQHVHSRVPAPSSKVRGIPSEIDELVVDSTDTDPDCRPPDAGAFLAAVADVRTELALPVTPVPPRVRTVRARVPARDLQLTPHGATTDVIRRHSNGASEYSTSVVPLAGRVGGRAALGQRDDDLPPPVVIPPPKRKPPLPPHVRRRRIGIIVALVILLLGVGGGFGSWYYLAGRYSRVPNVTGETLTQAMQALSKAHYGHVRVLPGPEFDDRPAGKRINAGLVLRTDPKSGSRVVKRSTITIIKSAGPHEYTIPPVKGMTDVQARAALARAGQITVAHDVIGQANMEVKPNLVIKTSPAAGQKVTRDQVVTLYESTGPPIIKVPTIPAGASVDGATKLLKHAGFKVHVDEEYNDTVKDGDVIAVSPDEPSPKGSTITITASKGPQLVAVPVITHGESSEDASAALEAVGLVPRLDLSFDGGVRDQVVAVRPGSGTMVPIGSPVTLLVI